MKKTVIASLLIVVVLGIGLLFADPGQKGNDLPKGKSYNFNVIGIPKGEDFGKYLNENFDGGNGKRIFISRTGTTRFYVYGVPDTFAINDHDGTDGAVGWGRGEDAGIFLPYDISADVWDCTVYVRLLGPAKPGDEASFRWLSEYYDSGWVPIDEFTLNRSSKFSVPAGQILKDGYRDILWTWDEKHNFRICQFRIFVGAPDGGYPVP